MLQEISLSIFMAARFNFREQAASVILVAISFAAMALFVNISIYYTPITLFPNMTMQYSIYWKKIIYPIFVIAPIENHFVLFIFLIFFTILETAYEMYKNPEMRGFSRWACYRSYEIILLSLGFLVFYIIETVANSANGSQGYRYFSAILLAIAMISPLIELPFGVY